MMRKSAFVLCDDHNAYIGYTSGRLWNGWATPYFTLEEAQRLQADFNQGIENPMLYDVNKDVFVLKYEDDDEPYIWEGEDIQTVDGIKHLYGIGAYSHIWDELDDGIKLSLAHQLHDFLYDYDINEYHSILDGEDEEGFIENVINEFSDLNLFVKVYEIMNNDAYNADTIYAELSKI